MDVSILLAAVFTFIMFLALCAVIFRLTRQDGAITWIIRVYFAAAVCVGIYYSDKWTVTEYVWWFTLYTVFTALFVFGVFSILEASVTIRILSEIGRSEKGLSYRDLLKKSGRASIIKRRIERLLYSGELKENHGTYTPGKTSYFRIRELVLHFFRLAFTST